MKTKEHPGGGLQQDPAPAPADRARKMDTANHFEVVETQTGVAMISPPMARQVLSRQQALNLAAWLLVMARCNENELVKVLREIART